MNTRARSEYASDPELAALRKPVRAGYQRPEFVAASAAARDRERAAVAAGAKTALPPPFVASKRPAPPSARLKDLSNWQISSSDVPNNLTFDSDVPEQLPSTPMVKPSSMKGKPNLLETVMRRNVARRASASRSSLATTTGVQRDGTDVFKPDHDDQDQVGDPVGPPSPSLAATKVRRRIAAVRSRFKQAAVEKRMPHGPTSGLFDEDEDVEEDEDEKGGVSMARKADNGEREVAGQPRVAKRQQSPRLATTPETRSSRSAVDRQFGASFVDPFSSSAVSIRPVTDPSIALSATMTLPASARNFYEQLSPPDSLYGFEEVHLQGNRQIFQGDDEELFERRKDTNEDEDDSDYVPGYEIDDVAEEYEGMGRLPLYEYDCLPEHLQESPDILTGYRINYTTSQCFRSVFAWHNDSVAIWTLLGSTAFFAYLSVQNINHTGSGLYGYRPESNYLVAPFDRYVIAGYCATIAMSSALSALYSLFRPHKDTIVHDWFSLLDFDSYFVWTFAAFSSTMHFSAYCEEDLQRNLLAGTLLVTVIGALIPWTPLFYSRSFDRLQQYYHSVIVLPMAIMAMYAMYTMGYDMALAALGDFRFPILGFFVYIIGNWCYQSYFPESVIPYKFDHFCNSQQIWHWSLITTAYCVYRTLQQFAAARATTICEHH